MNDLLTLSLSPQLMQWKQLQILEQKWNGQFPQVVGSATTPLLKLSNKWSRGQAICSQLSATASSIKRPPTP